MRGQLAITLSLPIALLIVTALVLSLQFATLDRAQAHIAETTKASQAARDLVYHSASHKLATRGFIMTLKPFNLASMSVAEAGEQDDYAVLAGSEADVPGLASFSESARRVSKQIDERDRRFVEIAQHSRSDVLAGYLGNERRRCRGKLLPNSP